MPYGHVERKNKPQILMNGDEFFENENVKKEIKNILS